MKNKIIILSIVSLLSFLAGEWLGSKMVSREKEIQIVEVEKVVMRENVRTVITEQPNGTKTTIIEKVIDTIKNTQTNYREKESVNKPKWSVWASGGVHIDQFNVPVYSFGIDKNLIWDLSVGLYGRTDSEFGLTLRYTF